MRIVPDQNLEHMVSLFRDTLQEKFAEFQSPNELNLTVGNQADWWLGDPENKGFKALEKAIGEEWGVEPLYIREVPYSSPSFANDRAVRSQAYGGLRRNSTRVPSIFLWGKLAITRTWLMSDYGSLI